MFLTSADEAVRYIGGTFRSAFSDPTLGPKLAASPARVRFGLVDPDCVLVIDAARGEVSLGCKGDAPTTGMVAMNADNAIRYFQGRLDRPSAIASGDIATTGEVQFFLSLVESGGLGRLYAELVERDGRQDLLVS